jgi:hypothetical protein
VPTTTEAGKGVITIPPTANVEAIRRSPTDEATSQARVGLHHLIELEH